MEIRGAKTKGWIKNNDTGELKEFQFNPEKHSYSRGGTFSEISSPGLCYPLTQWVKGNIREFPVSLYLFDAPEFTNLIPEFTNFIGRFLTPETNIPNYTRPPSMTFCFGTWIRKCVLTNLDITWERTDNEGRPIEANLTLTLRQVGV